MVTRTSTLFVAQPVKQARMQYRSLVVAARSWSNGGMRTRAMRKLRGWKRIVVSGGSGASDGRQTVDRTLSGSSVSDVEVFGSQQAP